MFYNKNISVQIFNDLANNQTIDDFKMSIIFQKTDQQCFTYALRFCVLWIIGFADLSLLGVTILPHCYCTVGCELARCGIGLSSENNCENRQRPAKIHVSIAIFLGHIRSYHTHRYSLNQLTLLTSETCLVPTNKRVTYVREGVLFNYHVSPYEMDILCHDG